MTQFPIFLSSPRSTILLLSALVILTVPVSALTVADYLKQASGETAQGDLINALKDYTLALEQDPHNAAAYAGRGTINNKLGNIQAAVADFTKAIELNPNPATYYKRGMARSQLGDNTGALADFNQSAKLDPKKVATFQDLASLEFRTGNLDEAIAAYTRAIELEPKSVLCHYRRAQARYMKDELAGAADDFQKAAGNDPAPPRIYKALLLWVTESKSLGSAVAGKNLESWYDSQNKSDLDAWSLKVAQFLMGHLDEKTFLAAAASSTSRIASSQSCEAFYYAGIKRLRNGEKDVATDYFRKCLATAEAEYMEYQLAGFELNRLSQKPVAR